MIATLNACEVKATRTATEHRFVASDGVELFYRAWAPTVPSAKAVVLFHRGHEHSDRWHDFVERSGMNDCWFFAWDARGHGHSPGERGAAESVGRLVRDADEFIRHITQEHGIGIDDMAVVGQSVGAVVALAWVHDYAPPIRALVLATPALRVKLYVPLAIPALRLLHRVKPNAFISSYVKPEMLTHDEEQARRYASDPLISPQIAVNVLLDLYDTSTRLIEDAGAIQTPTLLLVSDNDWVVEREPQEDLFDRLSSKVKEKVVYEDFFHSTFWEKDRDRPIAKTREFIESQLADPAPMPDLRKADREGYTKEVVDRLGRPLSLLCPKRCFYALQRLGLYTIGRLSRGVRIGWQKGFDSGESLDHVYRNTPEGWSPIGRLLDRIYLNSPGWRGIRQRKVHLAQMLDHAIAATARRGEPVRILDIAAGPGRYVLEAVRRCHGMDITAVLCDRDVRGLEAGRRLAEWMGVRNATYEQSDAFDPQAIAAVAPRPNIGIVSGLYELFPDNDRVLTSLRGLSTALPTGGLLIYTNQPWHPQQEMIARVLPNRDGAPWIMRCRTQAEMDQLIASAGFRKLNTLIDNDGIFTVSLAVKE